MLCYRGIAKKCLNDLEGAVNDFTLAIKKKSCISGYYFQRGIARFDKGDLTGAADDLRIAVEMDPENCDAYFDLDLSKDTVELDDWNVNRLIAEYSKVIQIYPNWPMAYLKRGILGRFSELFEINEVTKDVIHSLEIGRKIISEIPIVTEQILENYATILFWLRVVVSDRRDSWGYHENVLPEIEVLDKIIEIDPDIEFPYEYRGYLRLEKLHDYKGAISDYTRYIEFYRTDNPQILAIPYYNRGEAFYNIQNFIYAEADFKKSVELGPDEKFEYYTNV